MQNILKIIEKNISKVLFGPMPENNHISKAREVLIFMISQVPESSPVYEFILNNLHKEFKLTAKVVDNKLIPDNPIKWKDLVLSSLPFFQGGTYMFKQLLNNTEYIGSAASFVDRMRQHKKQFLGHDMNSLHNLEVSRLDTLEFGLIHNVPNLLKQFQLEHPDHKLTLGEYEVLMAFTIYPVRVLEQHLIEQFKPFINGKTVNGVQFPTTVLFPYSQWSANRLSMDLSNNKGAIIINICAANGTVLYVASSLYEASYFIDKSPRSTLNYINNEISTFSSKLNREVYLRSLDTTRFGEVAVKPLDRKLSNTTALELPNTKLNELSPVFIYAFLEDKIQFITFKNVEEAFLKLFPNQYLKYVEEGKRIPAAKITTRFNLNVPLISEDGKIYFMATNPSNLGAKKASKLRPKPVDLNNNTIITRSRMKFLNKENIWVVNIITMQATLAANLTDATLVVSSENNGISITLSHVRYLRDTGKIYKGTYIFICNSHFESLFKDICKPGLDTISLTQEQIPLLKGQSFLE